MSAKGRSTSGKPSLKTTSGYEFSEVASALQKSIRRGLEEEAMYWAIELELKYSWYLWRRLQIISMEDIGIASMETVLYVAECRKLYLELRKKDRGVEEHGREVALFFDLEPEEAEQTHDDYPKGSHRLMLSNAILAMCRAPKSRVADDFQITIYRRRREWKSPGGQPWHLDIPEWALDMHTKRGRNAGRGRSHFNEVGTVLENESKSVPNPYKPKAGGDE